MHFASVVSQAPDPCLLPCSVTKGAALLAGTGLGILSSGVGQPQALDFAIRSAAVEDYWSIAEVHAQSFYPSANWLLGPLLRLDRVHALQVGHALLQQPPRLPSATQPISTPLKSNTTTSQLLMSMHDLLQTVS